LGGGVWEVFWGRSDGRQKGGFVCSGYELGTESLMKFNWTILLFSSKGSLVLLLSRFKVI
jgi:hypothetical protein